jgi:hypothetical protein
METGSQPAEGTSYSQRKMHDLNSSIFHSALQNLFILQASYSEAWRNCSVIGLKLLSLDTLIKNKCFTDLTESMYSLLVLLK